MSGSGPPSLDALLSSFAALESELEPLIEGKSLPETLLALSTIQQAKLQTVLPYLVYDLVFIYLKTKGIDPRTHHVVPELDRVKEYFQKIKDAENPAVKRTTIDKAAADRFIKHAVTQAKNGKNIKPNASEANEEGSSEPVPLKTTSKMIARMEYEQELRELDAEEEEEEDADLQVFDEAASDFIAISTQIEVPAPTKAEETSKSKSKRKGESKSASTPESAHDTTSGSRSSKRRKVDPFSGGDEASSKKKKKGSAT